MDRTNDLQRINDALDAAVHVLEAFTPGSVESTFKSGDDPLTKADLMVDELLHEVLPRHDEGWLSEETVDSSDRLGKSRVWIVDPIDGTREFVEGVPEWCVSIGLIEDGVPVAGGIHNPATGERFIGAIDIGVTYDGERCISGGSSLSDAAVCASRSEVRRGEWDRFTDSVHTIVPTGSVAYKMALVGAGLLDATWTLVPKHEWDLAAGAALVLASGGWIALSNGSSPTWNNKDPLVPGFIAATAALRADVEALLL